MTGESHNADPGDSSAEAPPAVAERWNDTESGLSTGGKMSTSTGGKRAMSITSEVLTDMRQYQATDPDRVQILKVRGG